MKMIKLLLCTAISVLITGCPDMTFGASCITLIVENKSNIGFYLEVQGGDLGPDAPVLYYDGHYVKKDKRVSYSRSYDGTIDDLTFNYYLDFYDDIKRDINGKYTYGNVIKKIGREQANSLVKVEEDNRDKHNAGEVVYKLVVTDGILGINAPDGGQSENTLAASRSAGEALYSFKGYVKKATPDLLKGHW